MKRLIAILSALALALPLGAQSIKMDAPDLVAGDEQFNVSFTIEGEKEPSDFRWEPGGDFKLVWGPQKGTARSINIINGKTTRSSTITYTYILLPLKEGTFILPPAEATIKGKKISSDSRSIQVLAGSGANQAAPSPKNEQRQPAGTVSNSDIYMKLLLSKNSAVVGESLTATLKLYQRVNIAGFEDARFPSFEGFWSKETAAPSDIEFRRENVGGVIYNTAVLRSWSLTPQKAGTLAIDPAELVCLVNVREPSSGTGSIFDSFFMDDYRTIRKRVSTPAVTVNVRALPPAPPSFGGGVGKFGMQASLSADSLKTHDAGSLRISISGTGNIALLEAPKVDFPPDFEVYDVKVSESASGKTFEYPFIPRSHGDFVIGPVEYSYYDIASGRYRSINSQPLNIHVQKSASTEMQAAATVPAAALQKNVKDLGSDIRFISSEMPSFKKSGRFFVASPLFWGIAALFLAAAGALYVFLKKRAALKENVVLSRGKGAVKMARKRLASASLLLGKNLYGAFYEELHKALLGFAGDKFALDAADLSKENITAKMQSSGIPKALAGRFGTLLDECEYARFAPDAGHGAMNAHYEEAVSVISDISSYMKKSLPKALPTLLALLVLLPYAAYAQSPDSLWNAGVSAYTAGNYAEALDSWQALEGQGLVSDELYTNIADAFFKQDDIARAILYYNRALSLNPSNADARHNLQFTRAQVRDRIDRVPEFFLITVLRNLRSGLSSNAWAALSLLFFAAVLAMLLLYLLARRVSLRRTGFYAGIASLLLCIAFFAFAYGQKKDFLTKDGAVVSVPSVSVGSAPSSADFKALFVLHEGTELRVSDILGDWAKVELPDGRQGWLRKENIEMF